MRFISSPLNARRLILVTIAFSLLYELAMRPPIRDWYRSWDKLAHALAFFLVCLALVWALPWRLWLVALVTAIMGLAVEIHQLWLPGFSPSFKDWLADVAGIAIAVFFILLLPSRNSSTPKNHGH